MGRFLGQASKRTDHHRSCGRVPHHTQSRIRIRCAVSVRGSAWRRRKRGDLSPFELAGRHVHTVLPRVSEVPIAKAELHAFRRCRRRLRHYSHWVLSAPQRSGLPGMPGSTTSSLNEHHTDAGWALGGGLEFKVTLLASLPRFGTCGSAIFPVTCAQIRRRPRRWRTTPLP